jgi:hypothetical protein
LTDLTARLTAIEEILAFLLAEHMARTPEDKRGRFRSSFFGRKFVPSTGPIDTVRLEALRLETEVHLTRLFDVAEHHVRDTEREPG